MSSPARTATGAPRTEAVGLNANPNDTAGEYDAETDVAIHLATNVTRDDPEPQPSSTKTREP